MLTFSLYYSKVIVLFITYKTFDPTFLIAFSSLVFDRFQPKSSYSYNRFLRETALGGSWNKQLYDLGPALKPLSMRASTVFRFCLSRHFVNFYFSLSRHFVCRSCLADCLSALKLQPQYEKALVRAAQCCYHLSRYKDCLSYCNQVLEVNPSHSVVSKLRSEAMLKDVSL